jgi:hypothetical protein
VVVVCGGTMRSAGQHPLIDMKRRVLITLLGGVAARYSKRSQLTMLVSASPRSKCRLATGESFPLTETMRLT